MQKDNKTPDIDIYRLARLCHLTLSEEEAALLADDFKRMADYIYLHTRCTDAFASATKANTLSDLRDDTPSESVLYKDILAAAPETESGYIRVPKVVENGGDGNE